MTINDRQVTLAVFRQLYEQPLISDDGTLNGVPWGLVNYHPDKCADWHSHLHVVWQKGDELRRAMVFNPPRWDNFECDTADDYYSSIVFDEIFFGIERHHRTQFHFKTHSDVNIVADLTKLVAQANALECTNYEGPTQRWDGASASGQWFASDKLEKLNEKFSELAFERARIKGAGARLERMVAAEVARRNKHRETIRGLEQLPQLFIAV